MTRQELLVSVDKRIVYIPKEDYYDKPYILAKVVFCGKEYSASVGTESISVQTAQEIGRSNILEKVNKWLDKQEVAERERRLRSEPYEEMDKERLREYLDGL
jgi:hypothetical protein